jgi:hypothetical protein
VTITVYTTGQMKKNNPVMPIVNPVKANKDKTGRIPPKAVAAAVAWNNRFDRLRLIARRMASAITIPAIGATKIVKNPILEDIKLPIYARMTAIPIARK